MSWNTFLGYYPTYFNKLKLLFDIIILILVIIILIGWYLAVYFLQTDRNLKILSSYWLFIKCV